MKIHLNIDSIVLEGFDPVNVKKIGPVYGAKGGGDIRGEDYGRSERPASSANESVLENILACDIEKTIKVEISKNFASQFGIPPIKNIMRFYNSNKNGRNRVIEINQSVGGPSSIQDAAKILGSSFSDVIIKDSKR